MKWKVSVSRDFVVCLCLAWIWRLSSLFSRLTGLTGENVHPHSLSVSVASRVEPSTRAVTWTRRSEFHLLENSNYRTKRTLPVETSPCKYIDYNLHTLYRYVLFSLVHIIHHRNTRWHIHRSSGSTSVVHCKRYAGPQWCSFVLAPSVRLQMNSAIRWHQIVQIVCYCGSAHLTASAVFLWRGGCETVTASC